MKYKFSKRSLAQLATCHPDLQRILTEALKVSDIDFGISEGHRPAAKQKEYFDAGKSKIDGVKKKSKHNLTPSMAADTYAYVGGVSYKQKDIIFLAGVVTATANSLFAQGEITHKVRWGGNWDRDGEIITDQNFQDLVHFELYKP